MSILKKKKSLRELCKEKYGDDFIEMTNVPMHYVSYKVDDQIRNDANHTRILHQFIYDFPEIEYIYIIRKDDILHRRIRCEEAIAIRTKLALQRNLDLDNEAIEHCPGLPSIFRIVKLPINFMGGDSAQKEEVKRLLFDNFLERMEEKGYQLAGDAVGVKIGFSKEQNKEMQYIVLGMPIVKKAD